MRDFRKVEEMNRDLDLSLMVSLKVLFFAMVVMTILAILL
jgi:hypothetical protein